MEIKKTMSQNYPLNKEYSWLMYLIIWNYVVYFCIL